eukprot:scaffold1307_cov200-Pinguiococcus_pyrenoidosus.AAC.45
MDPSASEVISVCPLQENPGTDSPSTQRLGWMAWRPRRDLRFPAQERQGLVPAQVRRGSAGELRDAALVEPSRFGVPPVRRFVGAPEGLADGSSIQVVAEAEKVRRAKSEEHERVDPTQLDTSQTVAGI